MMATPGRPADDDGSESDEVDSPAGAAFEVILTISDRLGVTVAEVARLAVRGPVPASNRPASSDRV